MPGRPPILLPKRGGNYDFAGLVRAVEGAADGGRAKRTLTIKADRTVTYATVIATTDATRPTFPDVLFDVPE